MGQIRAVRWQSTRTFTSTGSERPVTTTAAFRAMNWRRRIAPFLLILAALGAYRAVGSRLPHDREVSLDLGPAAQDVTHVELAWTDVQGHAEEPAMSTQWNFVQGTAPERLNARVRLEDGAWLADVRIDRNGQIEPSSWSRRVYLEGRQVILPLREALR